MIEDAEITIPIELRRKFKDLFDSVNDTITVGEIQDWSPQFSEKFEEVMYAIMLARLGEFDQLERMGWL